MIYHFIVRTQESPEFLIEIELDGKHTFFNFHHAIQVVCRFQPHQLASFFVLDKKLKKQIEVSMLDIGVNEAAFCIMHKTKIAELLHSEGQKLIYTFDFIDDRSLLIELTDIYMEKNLNEPYVASYRGIAPVQVLEDFAGMEVVTSVEDPAHHDYGILDDYAQIFGEMDEF
jgi:hypothetical protein